MTLPHSHHAGLKRHREGLLAVIGTGTLLVAMVASPSNARAAAGQDWSPFVLVAGLLLIGLVANDDGLFAAAGYHLARISRNGTALFIGVTALIGMVTALLNLDTSVAFLTPVLISTANSRGNGQAPLLYGSLLLANAGSLFLPGSNLTNLIVLGHLHMSGAQFFSHMWFAGLSALLVTAAVIVGMERQALQMKPIALGQPVRPAIGLGLVAIILATAIIVALPNGAPYVAFVGVTAAGVRLWRGNNTVAQVTDVLGAPVLVGLFGLAVALGTLGRSWNGPAMLLTHVDQSGTALVATVTSVLTNNLPAASLLAARTPPHPFALLIGLNIGPNLCVTGSLAWVLWLRAAKAAGVRPSIAHATRIGLIAVPLSVGAALGALTLMGTG